MVKFKHINIIKEEKKPSTPKYKMFIKNNKMLVFLPKKPNKDKKYGNLCYSVNPDNTKCNRIWVNTCFWGKLEGKWKKYSGIREYWSKFKNNLPLENYLIALNEEKQEENNKNISTE